MRGIPSLSELMVAAGREDESRPKLALDIEAIRLRDAAAAFTTRHQFHIGQIVRQKPHASNYKPFGDNDIAIVIELLAEPILYEGENPGSDQFRMRLDMLIASLEGEKKHFAIFHVDSRRFEPVPPAELSIAGIDADDGRPE